MESSWLEKDKEIENNIIKDKRNLSRMKKVINGSTYKDIRNFFRLKKEKKQLKRE